jgi:hypothetical protein
MPKTNADYQREHRERRTRRLAVLEAAAARHDEVVAGLTVRIATLEAERDRLYITLEEASAGPPVPQASACPHPAQLVDNDRCGGCGQVVDGW